MLKQYSNKKIIISFFALLSLFCCKKNETIKNDQITNSVVYKAGNEGVNLSEEQQKEAFGKWELTNVVYFDDNRRTSNKIAVNEIVTVSEQGVFNLENKAIADKYKTVGTYKFKNLDTLNTTYYIFKIDRDRMMMKSPILFRIVNGKMTKQRARAEIYLKKNNIFK
jgi:hypothetical protein